MKSGGFKKIAKVINLGLFKVCLPVSVILFSCKRDQLNECPPQKFHTVSYFNKLFNFKLNGKWYFKNSSNSKMDTLFIYTSTGLQMNVPYYPHENCPQDGNETFFVAVSHNMFPGGTSYIEYFGSADNLTVADSAFQYVGVFQNNVGDSIKYKNNTRWNKLESFYSTLNVNGITYQNVYQMYYYPHLCGFRRIWWCPTIGFIKFEFINKNTNLIESWELNNYTVQLN